MPPTKPSKRPTAKLRSWRVTLLRQRARHIGVVEAPNEKAAQAAAISQFHLSEDQRQRLVVQEEE
jgi:hypothetical protein